MSNEHYSRMSILAMLKVRKKKGRSEIRQYLINESLIDSDDTGIDYFWDTGNPNIRRIQTDIRKLDYLILKLKEYES